MTQYIVPTQAVLLTPDQFLELAERHGISKTKAFELPPIAESTWKRWCYQIKPDRTRFTASRDSMLKLGEYAVSQGWL